MTTHRAHIPTPEPPQAPQPVEPPPTPPFNPRPIDDPKPPKQVPPISDPPPDERPDPRRYRAFGPTISSGFTHWSYCSAVT